MSYMLVSRAGRDAPLSAVSDMKGALGLVGVFLSFLLGELCGLPPLPSLSPSLPRSLPLSLAAANACSSAAHVGGAAVIVRVFLRGCVRARVDFADLTVSGLCQGGAALVFHLMTFPFFLLLAVLDTSYGQTPLPPSK